MHQGQTIQKAIRLFGLRQISILEKIYCTSLHLYVRLGECNIPSPRLRSSRGHCASFAHCCGDDITDAQMHRLYRCTDCTDAPDCTDSPDCTDAPDCTDSSDCTDAPDCTDSPDCVLQIVSRLAPDWLSLCFDWHVEIVRLLGPRFTLGHGTCRKPCWRPPRPMPGRETRP